MANITYRVSTNPTVPSSTTAKGSGLTNEEVDGNFKSLNDVKLEGTVGVSNGGTGLTTYVNGGLLYANTTTSLATNSALTFNGSNFLVNAGARIFNAATLTASGAPGTLSFETPIFRQYIGDGTGYSWALSKRSSSVTTDIVTVSDSTNVVNFALATPTIQGVEIATKTYVDTAIDNNVNVKSISIFTPINTDSVTLLYTQSITTISKLVTVLSGNTPSVTYTIKYGSSKATGTEVMTGGATTTSTTTGNITTTFSNAVVPANNFIWLEVTAVSGTVNEFHATINITFQ